jgi:hypothetical protein
MCRRAGRSGTGGASCASSGGRVRPVFGDTCRSHEFACLLRPGYRRARTGYPRKKFKLRKYRDRCQPDQ